MPFFQAFPSGLLKLKRLDTANLSKNKIVTLPTEMSELSCTELNLNQNQISALPVTLASSARLKTLRLEENCLTLESIPPPLLGTSCVSTLQLAGNLFDEKNMATIEGYDKYLERYTAVKRKLD